MQLAIRSGRCASGYLKCGGDLPRRGRIQKLDVHLNLRANAHHVAADAAKFQQIVWNLLKNAVKFTPDGGEIAISSSNPSPDVSDDQRARHRYRHGTRSHAAHFRPVRTRQSLV